MASFLSSSPPIIRLRFSAASTEIPTISKDTSIIQNDAKLIILFFHEFRTPWPTRYLMLLGFIDASYNLVKDDISGVEIDNPAAEVSYDVMLMRYHQNGCPALVDAFE